jgi:hypothetical protein
MLVGVSFACRQGECRKTQVGRYGHEGWRKGMKKIIREKIEGVHEHKDF